MKERLTTLEREEKILRSLILHSSLGIVSVDRDMQILFCNPVFERMFQYKSQEIIGKNLDTVISRGPSYEKARIYSAQILGGSPVKGEGQRFRKDGTPIYVEFHAVPAIVDGKVIGAYGLYEDVSEKIRLKEKLTKSEKRLKQVFQASPLGIGLVSNQIIQWHNEAMSKLLGYTPGELIGENVRMIYPSDEEFRKAGRCLRGLSAENRIAEAETQWVRKNGEIFDCHLWYSLLDKEMSHPTILTIAEDITERKRIETLLRESEERYRQLVEVSPLPIGVYNQKSLYFKNKAMMKLLRAKSDEDFKGKVVWDFIHPDSLPNIKNRLARILKGESLPPTVQKLLTLDGETLEVEIFSVPVTYQGKRAIMSTFSDVTEKRKAEAKLKEGKTRYLRLYKKSKRQEELYQSLLTSSADAIAIYNLRGETEFINPSFTKIFGWTLGEIKGKRIPFVPAWERKATLSVIRDLLQNGTQVQGFETQRYTKDGRLLDISISASRYSDHEGKPAGMLVVLRDITERKRAEQKLIEEERKYRELYTESKRQEEMYRSLLRSSADAIVIYNLRGEVEFISPSFTKIFGWTLEEIRGKQIPFVPESEKAATTAVIGRLFKEKEPVQNFETKRLTKDGRILNISISGSLFSDVERNHAGMLVVLRDITERVRAEKEIQKSEKRFRDLFNSVSDLIYEQDLEGRFLSFNQAIVNLLGYKPEEIIGKKGPDLMKPELRPYYKSQYLASIRKTGRHQGISVYFTKEGRKVYLEHNSILVKQEGAPPYISGIARDVTERILSNRRIKKLREEMLQAQKMEAIGTLAGGIAHDFNNILMGIQGNISLMKVRLSQDPFLFEKIRTIEEHIERGSDLASQLLGFARGGRYQIKPTDLNTLITREANLFGRAKKEIELHLKLQKNLWPVEVDQRQIAQVLLNLFINAWQAMPRGGHIFIQTQNITFDDGTLPSRSLSPGRYVQVTITDTGIGMDEKTQKKIFDPFFTTKEKERGTGLGLASVYGIIKHHGGIIDVSSTPGEGSSFIFYLPATDKAVQVESKSHDELIRGKGRVLLIDDEEKILQVGEQLLQVLGYEVMTCRRGKEAVEVFKREKGNFDLVILDMIMPGMRGQEVFQALRTIKPDIRVLLASGYSIDGEASTIMAQGCNGFIQKPFSMEKLSTKIQEILKGK